MCYDVIAVSITSYRVTYRICMYFMLYILILYHENPCRITGTMWENQHISSVMTTSSNGNIFRVTGHLCGEFTGPGEFPTQRPVTRSFGVSLICVWINGWANNHEAGDLRRHRGYNHYDVNVMATEGSLMSYFCQTEQTVENKKTNKIK